jgi:hypothetical protein
MFDTSARHLNVRIGVEVAEHHVDMAVPRETANELSDGGKAIYELFAVRPLPGVR